MATTARAPTVRRRVRRDFAAAASSSFFLRDLLASLAAVGSSGPGGGGRTSAGCSTMVGCVIAGHGNSSYSVRRWPHRGPARDGAPDGRRRPGRGGWHGVITCRSAARRHRPRPGSARGETSWIQPAKASSCGGRSRPDTTPAASGRRDGDRRVRRADRADRDQCGHEGHARPQRSWRGTTPVRSGHTAASPAHSCRGRARAPRPSRRRRASTEPVAWRRGAGRPPAARAPPRRPGAQGGAERPSAHPSRGGRSNCRRSVGDEVRDPARRTGWPGPRWSCRRGSTPGVRLRGRSADRT